METNTLIRFRSKLKKRLMWAGVYNLFVVLIIFVNRFVGNQYSLSDMATGFIDQTVFFTILCVLQFTVLVKGSLKLYFHKKL